jgi:hypothetical protein
MVPDGMTSRVPSFLPPGLSPVDNEIGSKTSIEKLARLVEGEMSKERP